MVFARGFPEGKMGVTVEWDVEFQFGKMKILEMGYDDGQNEPYEYI